MIVNVTKSCIEIGQRGNAGSCPIALAIGNGCVVNKGSVYLPLFKKRMRLPLEAIVFIDDFDRNVRVEPFTFELEEGGVLGE